MKAKRLKLVTPVGHLVYPHLNEPDREFDPAGVYHTKLRCSVEAAQEFLSEIESYRDEQYQQALRETGKKKLNQNALPWSFDEEDETQVLIKFKLKAKVQTRSGDAWEQRPTLLDAALKPTSVSIGGGTEARISAEVNFYRTPAGDTGVTLWCKAVQVIELVERGGGGDYGFKPTEGFTDESEADLVQAQSYDF
jgi:hypothetical protein